MGLFDRMKESAKAQQEKKDNTPKSVTVMFEQLPESLSDMQKDTSYSTAGVGGEFECVTCEFSFDLGTERHKDVFGILPSSEVFFRISQLLDSPVCGILGNKFLAEHGIVIDYGSQMIYTKRNYNTKKKAATLQ